MRNIYRILTILLIMMILPIQAEAGAHRESVNVLTWWGYLAYPEIVKQVEDKCNVTLSFDEYYSNDEFLRRWEGHKELYDVIIFSGSIYNLIKSKLPHINNSTLSDNAKGYYPAIKSHYFNMHYPHNVAYFAHAMTGFLWNPENITISKNDSIHEIFKKADNKYTVIMDDPIEAKKLVEADGLRGLTLDNFNHVIQNASVYITNNYSQIYHKPNFAFSYSWSGEAVVDFLTANKKYQFLVHPKLSYITSDLLAQTSASKAAICVSKVLSSREVLSVIQNKDYYFSPYSNGAKVNNETYTKLVQLFRELLPNLLWIDKANKDSFQESNMAWQLIKIELNNSINRGEQSGLNS